MATMNVKDAAGLTVAVEKPLPPGQALAAASRPVVIASDQPAFPVSISGSITVASHNVTNAGVFAVQASQTGTWNINAIASITGTVHIDDNAASLTVDDGAGSLTVDNAGTFPVQAASAQSGVWNVRNQDGAGTGLTSALRGTQQALSVQIVDAAGGQITTFGGSGGTSSSVGSVTPATATASGFSDGTNLQLARVIDADTGAGTDYCLKTVPRIPASGGSIGITYGAGAADPGTARVTIDTGQIGSLVNGAVPTITGGYNYETVPISSTDQIMGATGAVGDYIEGLLCVVATAATSQVQIKDGNGGAITVLPNNVGPGVGSYYIPLGLRCINSTTPGWKITTAAGVTAIATGKFT